MHQLSKGDISDFISLMSDFFNDELIGKNKYIRDFSKGNQKKIGIAAAMLGNPEILILDEPCKKELRCTTCKPTKTR